MLCRFSRELFFELQELCIDAAHDSTSVGSSRSSEDHIPVEGAEHIAEYQPQRERRNRSNKQSDTVWPYMSA